MHGERRDGEYGGSIGLLEWVDMIIGPVIVLDNNCHNGIERGVGCKSFPIYDFGKEAYVSYVGESITFPLVVGISHPCLSHHNP